MSNWTSHVGQLQRFATHEQCLGLTHESQHGKQETINRRSKENFTEKL